MCGIAGLYRSRRGSAINRASVLAMLARIGHRGPDGIGVYVADDVAFGTARLSIVDPRGGDQPIGDETGRYWIAFNGEIYNYRELRQELSGRGHVFRTRSDTEVLLRAWMAWGTDVFLRLNGAFAVALYDRATGRLVLGRDRFGKRPLYFADRGGALSFASEIKGFLGYDPVSLRFDPARLASIFRVWTPIDRQTCFADVHQLPAGSILTATPHGCAIHSYASPPIDEEETEADDARAIEITRGKLAESVRRRLPDDVEAGTYLSGGLDSAIVTALAAQSVAKLKTFSVAFEDATYDESADQALVARHLGTDHHTIRLAGTDIADAFPQALAHAEVPVFRSAFVPMYLLSRTARDAGVKVVLTGEGADEGFFGYDIFQEATLRACWAEIGVPERRDRLARLYPYLDQFDRRNQAALYAYFDRSGTAEQGDLFTHDLRWRGSLLATRLLAGGGDGLTEIRQLVDDGRARFAGLSLMQRAQWLEFKTLLGGYLLSTQGDRMALAHGVENRCPFLDPDIVRWGAATRRFAAGDRPAKYLLRQAFATTLPHRVTNRAKQPYLAPDAAAFVGSRPDYLDLVLSDAELAKVDVLDIGFCRRLVAKVVAARGAVSPAENQAFMFLLSTVLLHRQFVTHPSPPPPTPTIVREIDGRLPVLSGDGG